MRNVLPVPISDTLTSCPTREKEAKSVITALASALWMISKISVSPWILIRCPMTVISSGGEQLPSRVQRPLSQAAGDGANAIRRVCGAGEASPQLSD